MRYLAIDYGETNIGLAYCDKLEISTRPLTPIKNKEIAKSVEQIIRLINQHNIDAVVVGLPLGSKNQETQQSIKIRFFADRLKELINKPVEFWNEALSSKEAIEIMIAGGRSKKARRELLDSYAAVVILKGFLEEKKK